MNADLRALTDELRRMVRDEIKAAMVPRLIWGVVSAKTGATPPRYTFQPEGAASPLANTWAYLGANPPANGETVGGLLVGTNLFLFLRQTGTS